MLETRHADLRLFKRNAEAQGDAALADGERLQDDMVVVVGPEITPKEAVRTLRAIASKIEEEGLVIGRKKNNGPYYYESAEGKVSRED